MSTRQQIEQAYARRQLNPAIVERDSLLSPPHLFMIHQREKEIVSQLRHHGITAHRLARCQVLEVGSGKGSNLRRLLDLGVARENLVGFDLLMDRLRESRRLDPGIQVVQADGTNMPFQDQSFDLILCFVVFSSILEPDARRSFAWEMRRVLRPSGMMLWHEFRTNNPWNSDVKAVPPAELRSFFPDCHCAFRRTTLAPPLTRLLYSRVPVLCELLSSLPFLLTHYVALISPRPASAGGHMPESGGGG